MATYLKKLRVTVLCGMASGQLGRVLLTQEVLPPNHGTLSALHTDTHACVHTHTHRHEYSYAHTQTHTHIPTYTDIHIQKLTSERENLPCCYNSALQNQVVVVVCVCDVVFKTPVFTHLSIIYYFSSAYKVLGFIRLSSYMCISIAYSHLLPSSTVHPLLVVILLPQPQSAGIPGKHHHVQLIQHFLSWGSSKWFLSSTLLSSCCECPDSQ